MMTEGVGHVCVRSYLKVLICMIVTFLKYVWPCNISSLAALLDIKQSSSAPNLTSPSSTAPAASPSKTGAGDPEEECYADFKPVIDLPELVEVCVRLSCGRI